jgi:hypothetical protein
MTKLETGDTDSATASRAGISPNHIDAKGGSFSKRRNCRELHDSLPSILHDLLTLTTHCHPRRHHDIQSGGSLHLLPFSPLDPLPPRPGGGRPLIRKRVRGTSREALWRT